MIFSQNNLKICRSLASLARSRQSTIMPPEDIALTTPKRVLPPKNKILDNTLRPRIRPFKFGGNSEFLYLLKVSFLEISANFKLNYSPIILFIKDK